MSNELTVTNTDVPELSAQAYNIIARGDLKGLKPHELTNYLMLRCRAVGLDPATNPFNIMEQQGKLVIYANVACSQQLCKLHKLSTDIIKEEFLFGDTLYKVTVSVSDPTGRRTANYGIVDITGLKGLALSNALMKGVTKAKRRTIFDHCGLGVLDETEVQDFTPRFDAQTGEIKETYHRSQPASVATEAPQNAQTQQSEPQPVQSKEDARKAFNASVTADLEGLKAMLGGVSNERIRQIACKLLGKDCDCRPGYRDYDTAIKMGDSAWEAANAQIEAGAEEAPAHVDAPPAEAESENADPFADESAKLYDGHGNEITSVEPLLELQGEPQEKQPAKRNHNKDAFTN